MSDVEVYTDDATVVVGSPADTLTLDVPAEPQVEVIVQDDETITLIDQEAAPTVLVDSDVANVSVPVEETVVEVADDPAPAIVVAETGVAGPPGSQGPQGPAGATGAPGPQGPVGASRFYGDGPPTVVIGAAPGDEYVDELTGDLYVLS